MRARLVWWAVAAPLAWGAAPARAYEILGPTDPRPAGVTPQITTAPASGLVMNLRAPTGVQLLAQTRSVVTRFRFFTGDVAAGATVQLVALTPVGEDRFVVGRSAAVETLAAVADPGDARDIEHTYAAQLPLEAGQAVGLGVVRPTGTGPVELLRVPALGWYRGDARPFPPPDGVAGPGLETDNLLPFNAEIQPDLDGDASGDDTQDRCPGEAGPDRGCPAGSLDPVVVRDAPTVRVDTLTAAAVQAELDPASVRFAARRTRLTARVRCPVQTAARCTGTLRARTRGARSRSLGSRTFSVPRSSTATVTLVVPASTRRAIAALPSVRARLTLTTTVGASRRLG